MLYSQCIMFHYLWYFIFLHKVLSNSFLESCIFTICRLFFFRFWTINIVYCLHLFFDNSFSGVVSFLISFILLFSQFFHIFFNINNNNSISIISFDTCSCNSFVIYGLKQKLRNGILWIIYIRTVDITCK